MKKKLSLFLILFFLQNYSFAQDQHLVDSLETVLKNHYASKLELRIKSPSLYDTTAAKILSRLSTAYSKVSRDTAIDYANISLKLSEEIGFKKGIGDAYNCLGTTYQSKGDYAIALDFLIKAKKIREEMGDKKRLAGVLHNIGMIYMNQGNYPEALEKFFAALKINDEVGNENWKGINLLNIGMVYNNQGDYPEAMKKYLAALKIFEKLGFKRGISDSYNQIGISYAKNKNYPEARKNYFASLKLSEEVGNKLGEASTIANIALSYHSEGNYTEALKNHFAALDLFEKLGSKRSIAGSFLNIGNTYTRDRKYKDATAYLDKALALSKEIGCLECIKTGFQNLAELDSVQGNYKKTLEHYKSYIIFRDSILNTENTKKTVALQMNYNFNRKQDSLNVVQTKKDLVAQKELIKQKLVRNGFIGGTIIFMLLASGAIVFYLDRMQRKRKKQMEEVRARISRDLHDDMGSTLQSISVMSEIARMKSTSDNNFESIPFIEKIGSASREMIDKMTDIVWAVNPKNDNFENIILHMRAFGGELLAGKDIALHFKTESDLNYIVLSMDKRKSFFLVYKEALNNAYKYSNAKNVNVEISKSNHLLRLVVEDDGVGFNINEDRLKTGGNGLKNMNTRAAELNGNISIISEPQHGTKVSLALNLN